MHADPIRESRIAGQLTHATEPAPCNLVLFHKILLAALGLPLRLLEQLLPQIIHVGGISVRKDDLENVAIPVDWVSFDFCFDVL